MGRRTRYALYVALACGFWVTFKMLEPRVFPVVKEFQITEAVDLGENVSISGRFNKVRECAFIDVVGYSGDQHVVVIFNVHPDAPVVTRLAREQTYGPWLLVPKVPQLELYSHHACATGVVTTKLFEGALVL